MVKLKWWEKPDTVSEDKVLVGFVELKDKNGNADNHIDFYKLSLTQSSKTMQGYQSIRGTLCSLDRGSELEIASIEINQNLIGFATLEQIEKTLFDKANEDFKLVIQQYQNVLSLANAGK